ncbi:HAD superfamily hydrolase, putative [Babesia bigemina]|uniref:HAD superfamily hydrolase, putative n=1 Tax=Babesia bigemina TaxID=5866 RepID=A0A061DAR8_BABBI|nr:HAD superfamily hydrolase, putative [Babesia bigemina]CDR94790.1 HAD superfamily hydrolase, putative [Babesia bigemina]|eukprot:XP_012766976.1 HAD superfamily hydrolase, putative [Babesia bigemina]
MSSTSTFVPPSDPPKYIGIDVDNTFHTHDVANFTKNKRAFRKLLESGYRPLFATGRPLHVAQYVLGELSTDGVYNGYPGVYQNGATVYNERGELVKEVKFSESFLRDFCAMVKSRSLEHIVVFLSASEMYALVEESACWQKMCEIWDLDTKLHVVSAEDILKSNIVQIMVSKYKDIRDHIPGVPDVDFMGKIGTCGLTDVNPPRVNKLEGLRALLGHELAESGNFAFIGDGSNDVEALQASQWSFAVGNASDSVKAAAKNVLEETNDQAAFAKMAQLLYGINVE